MMSTLRHLILGWLILATTCCIAPPTWGQGLSGLLSKGGSSSSPQPPAAPSDPFGRETPRDSMRNFLESCHGNKFERATQYLDLRKLSKSQRVTEGARVGQQLCALLDHDARF